MLMRTDPFGELDRLSRQLFGSVARPAAVPMDAYRDGDAFVVHFDLPGVDPGAVDVEVERNVLTVTAERKTSLEGREVLVSERPQGRFSRQLFLGDTLDADHIEADYSAGVLTLRIPVAEQAKPRKVAIEARDEGKRQAISA
jgi:HSP20 family protein